MNTNYPLRTKKFQGSGKINGMKVVSARHPGPNMSTNTQKKKKIKAEDKKNKKPVKDSTQVVKTVPAKKKSGGILWYNGRPRKFQVSGVTSYLKPDLEERIGFFADESNFAPNMQSKGAGQLRNRSAMPSKRSMQSIGNHLLKSEENLRRELNKKELASALKTWSNKDVAGDEDYETFTNAFGNAIKNRKKYAAAIGDIYLRGAYDRYSNRSYPGYVMTKNPEDVSSQLEAKMFPAESIPRGFSKDIDDYTLNKIKNNPFAKDLYKSGYYDNKVVRGVRRAYNRKGTKGMTDYLHKAFPETSSDYFVDLFGGNIKAAQNFMQKAKEDPNFLNEYPEFWGSGRWEQGPSGRKIYVRTD